MTENTFDFQKPHKEENKLPPNSKIQETDPLVSLRSGTWPFTFANRQKVSSLFSCRISLWMKAIYILKTAEIVLHSSTANLTSNPNRASSFWRLLQDWEDLKLTKFVTSTKQNTLPPLPPNRFLATQILGGNVTSRNSFLPMTKGGREERPWEGGWQLVQRYYTLVYFRKAREWWLKGTTSGSSGF